MAISINGEEIEEIAFFTLMDKDKSGTEEIVERRLLPVEEIPSSSLQWRRRSGGGGFCTEYVRMRRKKTKVGNELGKVGNELGKTRKGYRVSQLRV